MAGSIVFERPQENAIEELKEHLSHIDVAITKEQEINNGAGVKLHGLYQNKQVVKGAIIKDCSRKINT
jgi:hypothetical protein